MNYYKVLKLHPTEFRWIKQIMMVADKDKEIKRCIQNGKLTRKVGARLMKDLNVNNHSGGSINWSLALSKRILNSGVPIELESDECGFQYCGKEDVLDVIKE